MIIYDDSNIKSLLEDICSIIRDIELCNTKFDSLEDIKKHLHNKFADLGLELYTATMFGNIDPLKKVPWKITDYTPGKVERRDYLKEIKI